MNRRNTSALIINKETTQATNTTSANQKATTSQEDTAGNNEGRGRKNKFKWTEELYNELFRIKQQVEDLDSSKHWCKKVMKIWNDDPDLPPIENRRQMVSAIERFNNKHKRSTEGLSKQPTTSEAKKNKINKKKQKEIENRPNNNNNNNNAFAFKLGILSDAILTQFLNGNLVRYSTRTKCTFTDEELSHVNTQYQNNREHLITKNIPTLEAINVALYAAATSAATIKKEINTQQTKEDKGKQLITKIQRKIKKINKLRRLLESSLNKVKNNMKVSRYVYRTIKRQYMTFNNKCLEAKIKSLQLLKEGYIQYIIKIRRDINFRYINEMMLTDEAKAYAIITGKRSNNKNNNNSVNLEEVKNKAQQFWSNLWDPITPTTDNSYFDNLDWIKQIKELDKFKTINNTPFTITTDNITEYIKDKKNWSAPGPDGICNYWIKKIKTYHTDLEKVFNEYLSRDKEFPQWFCEGITYRIHKSGDTNDEANYRPITCINNSLKILTGIISKHLHQHTKINNQLMQDVQRGGMANVWGTYENLFIDRLACEGNSNSYALWIDITKAYDSTRHSWIKYVMKLHQVNDKIISILSRLMAKWNTRIFIGKDTITETIPITNGIFQGDALCPFLFCMTINPIGLLIELISQPIKLGEIKITHLMFIDDIKAYALDEENIINTFRKTDKAFTDVGMKINKKKCGITGPIGKLKSLPDDLKDIPIITPNNPYKYLGFYQSSLIDRTKTWNIVYTEAKERFKKILNSQLSAWNIARAFNSLIVGYLRYYWFDKVKLDHIDTLQKQLNEMLSERGLLHRNMNRDILYLDRKSGGRGFNNLTKEYKVHKITTAIKLHTSPKNKEITNYASENKDHVYKDAIEFCKELNLQIVFKLNGLYSVSKDGEVISTNETNNNDQDGMKNFKEFTRVIREQFPSPLHKEATAKTKFWMNYREQMAKNWINKWKLIPRHVDSHIWLALTENVSTKTAQQIIGKKITNTKCRQCNIANETLEHIVSACPIMLKLCIVPRHDQVVTILLKALLKPNNIKHEGKATFKNDTIEILHEIRIDNASTRTNKPDLIMFNHSKKTIMIIEISVPFDKNIPSRTKDKLTKYTPLRDTMRETHPGYKVTILPVIIGAFGTFITESTKKTIEEQEVQLNSLNDTLKTLAIKDVDFTIDRLVRTVVTGTARCISQWELLKSNPIFKN